MTTIASSSRSRNTSLYVPTTSLPGIKRLKRAKQRPSYERQRHPCPLQEVSNCDIKRQHGKLVSNGYSKSNSHYALSIYVWISSIPSAYALSRTSPAYYAYSHSPPTSKCWYF